MPNAHTYEVQLEDGTTTEVTADGYYPGSRSSADFITFWNNDGFSETNVASFRARDVVTVRVKT